MTWKPSFAIICDSNVLRSMVAQFHLKRIGIEARTFGVGTEIMVPGRSMFEQNFYSFGSSFETIHWDLDLKDEVFYQNMLAILERNQELKNGPERFQDCAEKFEIIITLDEKVFKEVKRNLLTRKPAFPTVDKSYVFNIDTENTISGAYFGAATVLKFVEALLEAEDYQANIQQIIGKFQAKNKKPVPYEIFYV